jgi:hypothetical protein
LQLKKWKKMKEYHFNGTKWQNDEHQKFFRSWICLITIPQKITGRMVRRKLQKEYK